MIGFDDIQTRDNADEKEILGVLENILRVPDLDAGIIVIEDSAGIRSALTGELKSAGLHVYAAPNLAEAYKLIDFYKRMDFALVDDKIPRIKGSHPVKAADKLYTRLVEKFPQIEVFAYAEEPKILRKPYSGIFPKQACTRSVCHMILDYVKHNGLKH